MSWDAWAAIGQLIGAAGVIGSLVFVGIQVRQSVRASKGSSFQALVSAVISVNMKLLDHPKILEAIDRAGAGKKLSTAEHRIYVLLILSSLRAVQSAHYQTQLGLLDRSKLDSFAYNLVRHLKSSTGWAVWVDFEQRTDAAFRQYVLSLLERSDTYETLFHPRANSPSPDA